ncbi:putative quinol monooxygenase [Actinoplanes sp. NPDC049265]|uniref:putative quinol monooxygenase n=1 Tax=Actinoplanes sp. NPDC049265 TaxID=3363902 RepID=UPI00371184D9
MTSPLTYSAEAHNGRTKIILAGRVFVPPKLAEEFLDEIQATYPIAEANPGNLLIAFSLEDPEIGSLTAIEQWESQEALDEHLATPEVSKLYAKWLPLMRNEVRQFGIVDESPMTYTTGR